MKVKIAPSLLACDFLHLYDEVKRAESSGADMLHCDVMDGVFVPNISFGFDIIKKIHSVTSLPLDVHMMTSAPQKYLEVLCDAGASVVTLHSNLTPRDELVPALKKIRSLGMKPSVALSPRFPASDAIELADYCDMVLVMTVEPGFGGQSFMRDMLGKIRELRRTLDSGCEIEVDGGIAPGSIGECAAAGANVFVVGTASFRAEDMGGAVCGLRKEAEEAAKLQTYQI